MRKSEALRIINNTLKNRFNKEKFKELTSNLFTNLNYKKERTIYSQNIVKAFRDGINSYEEIADFKNSGKEISVLTVELKRESSLDRARTMQRNFIAHYLEKTERGKIIDAALVAFYHKNLDYWRLSFVKLDKKLKFDKENGGVDIEKELTPAKRYSFLVGEEEPTHTAEQQLLPLLKKETMPTLENIEEAFKIEKVTEEFFDKYKNHFIDLKEELKKLLKKNPKIKKEFDSQNIHIVNFAKRIMSQLVFLYFIQKKGWLGVNKNNSWGTGPKDFIRKLFDKKIADYNNFFNDILEPLFYEGLAIKRTNDFYSKLNCKIPFLNGGLFEPLKNYDWQNTDILLDNKVFEDILDTFDLYNFTVREDEPLEKEVAVDPEMLGHVFEKLLNVEDRKAKGAYYTPSEVVHYMCQESLVNYLDGIFLDIQKDDLKILIQFGDLAVENDRAKINGTKSYEFKMPEQIRMYSDKIDKKLQNIKICDPAIGSGAFPVGMMKEIVKTRRVLSIYKNNSNENLYEFKRHAIQESIYGVDIDPGAVDIAKLRLWLSLVVDEDDIDSIKPLPNLEYKIMQGNSLIEEFMEINLDYEFENSGDVKIGQKEKTQLFQKHVQLRILVDKEKRINELIKDLNKTNKLYFNSNNPKKKKKLKSRIDNLIITIFEEELKAQKQDYFKEKKRIEKQADRVENSKKYIEKEIKKLNKRFNFDLNEAEEKLKEYTEGNKEKPFFLWKVFFANVFKENGGFDVVIANPPYVNTKEVNKNLKSKYKEIYGIKDDLYNYFFLRSYEILADNGILNFITSNTYLTINSKINLRKLFVQNEILEIIKTENVFDNVKVEPAIIFLRKYKKDDYNLIYKDAVNNFENPEIYNVNIKRYKKIVNNALFKPNNFNKKIQDKYGSKLKLLHNKWWDKIKTSRKIKKFSNEIENHRKKFKPGDITMLGLITEGGVGLQTGNNNKFIGVKEKTKYANRIIKRRPKKLYNAIKKYNITELSNINSKEDAKIFLDKLEEKAIRNLFDDLKSEYGKNIFGRGTLYKIIHEKEIADVDKMTSKEKAKGIDAKKPHYVLYDKGDKDGNRWYLESPYYLNWSKESVDFLNKYSGKSGGGMPVVRNSGFYFRKGFCWTDVNTTYLKARLKDKGVHDVLSMSLFSQLDYLPDWYFVCIINSKFISEYVDEFINNTSHFQINDARQVPIIIPTQKQLNVFEKIFNDAYFVKKKQFANEITNSEANSKLRKIQKNLDKNVYDLYSVTS